MKINLSKKQYECLIAAIDAGSSVYGILGDIAPEKYSEKSQGIEDLRSYFLSIASEFDAGYMTQEFKGQILMSDVLSNTLHEAIEDYDDETFWHELETRLGKRDFERTATADEKKEMGKNGGWHPDRIHTLYKGWIKEFEKHGIDRLGIMKA